MNVANHLATADLTSSAVGTAIRANAKVQLAGDYPATRRSTHQAIPLQPILASMRPARRANLSGQLRSRTLQGRSSLPPGPGA